MGRSIPTISAWEAEPAEGDPPRGPGSIEIFQRMCKAFGVTEAEFWGPIPEHLTADRAAE